MTGNAEIPGVLQLSADVIGNLGSLDEEELPGGLDAGVAAMQEGISYRQVRVCARVRVFVYAHVCVCVCA